MQAKAAGHDFRALPALLFSCSAQLPPWPLMQPSARAFCNAEQQDGEVNQPAKKYKGVQRSHHKWYAVVALPPAAGRKLHYIYSHTTAEEAGATVDTYLLALHGLAVKPHQMNFPNSVYSSEKVTAARQVLQAKYPKLGMLPASTKKTRLHAAAADRSHIVAVAARRAKTAAAHMDSNSQLVGVRSTPREPGYIATCRIVKSPGWSSSYLSSALQSAVEAAVVYDLVRINLYGPEYTVNFPPHIYSDSDAAVVRQDMQHRYPDIFTAAPMTAARQPPCSYRLNQARKAFDAAIDAAAAAAQTHQQCAVHGRQGVKTNSYGYQARVIETVAPNRGITFNRHYASALAAATAVDAMRQALGRPAVNLPASITAAGVPAAKAWLELDRIRQTTEKQQWAAQAAALTTAKRAGTEVAPAHHGDA